MIDIYYTYEPIKSDDFILAVLAKYYNIRVDGLMKSVNGKPFILGRKVHFNLTHSKKMTALAVGKVKLGLDCESLDGKPRPAVLQRFSAKEKAEISALSEFYAHWTARESFIKYNGESLAHCWRKVEYLGGEIVFCGEKQDVKITQFVFDNYVFSLCCSDTKYALHEVKNLLL